MAEGLCLWREEDGAPDIVTVVYEPKSDYEHLSLAAGFVRDGARFVATNMDAAIPRGGVLVPHTGAVAEHIKAASVKEPFVVGKPYA